MLSAYRLPSRDEKQITKQCIDKVYSVKVNHEKKNLYKSWFCEYPKPDTGIADHL